MSDQRVVAEERVALSAGQRGIWAAQRLISGTSAFRAGELVWLPGQVNEAAFASAVSQAFTETDALRVCFGEEQGTPFQRVDAEAHLRTTVVEEPLSDAEIRHLARTTLVKNVPATEATTSCLVRRADGTWAWFFTADNLLLDGYSVTLFIRRVAEIYSAEVTGPASEAWFGRLAEALPWQEQPSDPQALEYWRRLADVDAMQEPVSATISELFSFSYSPVPVALPEDSYDRLRMLARGLKASWSDALVALWGLYTALADRRADVILRVPFMMRERLLRTPSAMSRVLPVTTPIGPQQTLKELVGAVGQHLRLAQRRAGVEDSQIARFWPAGDVSYFALPSINIKIFDWTADFGPVKGLIETVNPGQIGRLDLSVYNDPVRGWRLELAGHENLIEPDEVRGHARAFGEFLQAALDAPPGLTLHELAESAFPIAGVPSAQRAAPDAGGTLDSLLWSSFDPDAVAVIDGELELSFAELDKRVSQFTRQLSGAGDRVAILLPRSLDRVVALLAVIRTGAACVPIDPALPSARVKQILADSGATHVISEMASGKTGPARERALSPDDAAFVIFTSGTTGRPKGVVLSHRAVVNRLTWGAQLLGLGPGDRALVKSSVGFVDAMTELLVPLAAGAAVVIAREEVATDPVELKALVARHRVTHLLTVPGLSDVLSRGQISLGSLRQWVSSGEVLAPATAAAMRRAAPNAMVRNFYGSTEVTGDATAADGSGIGGPVPGARVQVLDAWLRPVPVGALGELYVGGVQLAQGYADRGALTAERFVAAENGERLYRTGDLVRWNDRNELDFVGRADDQVKIRGFRIELEEIRNALESHEQVSGAAVLALDHPAGGKHLVAYVVTQEPDDGKLRAHLKALLPDYSVPAIYVRLDAFPATPNGKLDKRALPAPDLKASSGGRAPQTETETALATMFRDILALEPGQPLSVDDDFFRLGGHSLLATRLIARVNADLSQSFSLRDIFDRPTIAGLAEMAQAKSAVKRPRLGELDRPQALPVSFGQQSLWLVDRLGGPGGRYVVPIVLRLSGAMNESALTEALRDVVRRHEALRSLIVQEQAGLRQIVVPLEEVASRLVITVDDVTGVASSAVNARVAGFVQTRFDLAADLPVRALLLRTGLSDWVFVLAMHHHAVDEWSFPALLQDLSVAYRAQIDRGRLQWAALPVQYPDFAVWQRAALGEASDPESELARHLSYWRSALAGVPEESRVSTDRPLPVNPTYQGADVEFSVPAEVVAGLRSVAEVSGATGFMVWQTAVALTVSALGGGEDVVIGSPVGGRSEEGLADLVGYFVNTLPFRHLIHSADRLADVLDRSRETVLDALAHQAAPFELIADVAGVQPSAERNPLFQVMLTYRRLGTPLQLDLPGAEAQVERAPLGSVKTDLDLYLTDTPQGVTGFLSYATELYDPATVDRFVHLLQRVLGIIAAAPETPVAALRLASEDEPVAQTTDPDVCVDDLIRAQVRETPDVQAVLSDTGPTLTYAELDARVNAFAANLAEAGIKPGDRVAVVLPRSVTRIVALLGVLRAAAVCVPVDPQYPAERIRRIVADAGAALMVSEREVAGLTVRNDRPVPLRVAASGEAAFVIFTSGTTGRPKGVVLSHGALVNRLQWGAETLRLGVGDRVLVKSSVGFVDAVTELLGPLTAGAALVVMEDKSASDAVALAEAVRRHEVTHLLTVPGLADVLTRLSETLPSLRQWVSSGEVLSAATAKAMRATAPNATVRNFYGSTEVTGDATASVVVDGPGIGRPVKGTWLRILDAWLRPVPSGVVGELYIGGVQLAEGYAGRGALTSERFVASGNGERIYRTGDLVRRNNQGELEFVGRADDQMKIRGFRVEPAEIRNVLEQHDAVSVAVVVALDHPAGASFLAAYFTAEPGHGEDVETALREHAERLLPSHMVPTAFTLLGSFPVNANGKLDRTALPRPDFGSDKEGGRAPRTPTERVLAEIFSQVLRYPDAIHLDDDFFRMGGHSLLATQAIALVNARLTTQLTLRDVFDHPTVAGLAQVADNTTTKPLVRVGDIPRPQVLPVSFGQQSMWLVDQIGGAGARYVVPLQLRLSGQLDETALVAAVRDVVSRHEALRTLIVEQEGRLRQVVIPVSEVPSRLIPTVDDLTGQAADAVGSRVAELVQSRFDLGTDLPVRAGLLRTGTQEWLLVLAIHHHAVDEWSLPSLLGDLSTAYRARVDNASPQWLPLAAQYADFAVWQRQVLGEASDPDSQVAQELDYWRQALAEAPQESTISLDRPSPAHPSHRAADIAFVLDPEVLSGLRAVAADRGVTGFMVFQTAVALTVSALGGGDDVVIGSPVGGRAVPGLEDLVGYFVNTLPLRHRFRSGDRLTDVLDRSRATVLDGLAHQSAPFEQIAAAAGVERAVERNPVFQVMLTYRQLAAPLEPDLPGVDVRIERVPLGSVKTDLDVYVTETASGATGFLSYATELFEPAKAERFVNVLVGILRTLAEDREKPVSALSLVTLAGAEGDGGERSFRQRFNVCLDEVLWAKALPGAVALVTDDAEWSYSELEKRVAGFAATLSENGVTAGDRVALVLPRSVDRVVALLGTLRARAVCVPIDPGYPSERVQQLIAESGATLVVSTEGVSSLKGPQAPASDRRQSGAGSPDDAAFVIFTSGTTGRPKGVVLSHRAIANRLAWGEGLLGFAAGDRALAKSSVGFVDAVTELLGPLAAGAAVVVARDEAAGDPVALADAVARHRVTHLLTVPGLADVLTAVPGAGDKLKSLRQWVCSGEVLAPATVAAIRQVAPGAVLRNFYGSTEVTGDATAGDAGAGIGGPVPGTVVHVLDTWLRPVPPGVVGELYVGGAQLAQGYAERGALTSVRFIAGDDGERLYRTGDLVRRNEQGGLEFTGRADDQVKIRGFRVEPAEVRNVLEQHPAVSGAAVLALDHPAGGAFLAAYVTTRQEVLAQELREHLAQVLPDYMVPASITVLKVFPLTPNGKLDRRALPEPDLGTGSGGGRAPETENERTLAGIVREVLHLDREPSAQDDFFGLGGDSILAARLVAAALSHQLPLTLRDVFEHRSVAALAKAIPVPVETKTAEPVAVSSTLERLRESGADPNAWIYTTTFDVQHQSGQALREAYTRLIDQTDALRLQVQCVSRRLWLTQVMPSAQAAVTEGQREDAVRLVDVTNGTPSALAYNVTPKGMTATLAVHAGAADRASLHLLSKALQDGVERSVPQRLQPLLRAVEQVGESIDPAELDRWNELLRPVEQPDEGVFAKTAVWTFSTEGDVKPAVKEALRACGYTGFLDEEVALLEEVGPFTGTAPVPVSGEGHPDPRHFPLLRHHNKAGRRALRRVQTSPILLTRVYGGESEQPEGVELLYRAVVRYRIHENHTEILVLGLNQA